MYQYELTDREGSGVHRHGKTDADDLKLISVFKPSTDTAKFVEWIYVDVFGKV